MVRATLDRARARVGMHQSTHDDARNNRARSSVGAADPTNSACNSLMAGRVSISKTTEF